MHVQQRMDSKMVFHKIHLALIASLVSVCSAATTVSVVPVTALEVHTAVMMCEYSIDASATFSGMSWKKGDRDLDAEVVAVMSAAGVVDYPNGNYSEPDYKLTSTMRTVGSNLTIKSVTKNDGGTYRCDLFVREPFSKIYKAFALLTVKETVLPVNITVTNENGESLPNNSQVRLVTDKASYVFASEVPDIYPGVALFKWPMDGVPLPEEDVTSEDVDSNGLITSKSTVTLKPLLDYNGKRLGCQAFDESGVELIAFYMELIVDGTTTKPPGAGCALARLDLRLFLVSLVWVVTSQIAAHF